MLLFHRIFSNHSTAKLSELVIKWCLRILFPTELLQRSQFTAKQSKFVIKWCPRITFTTSFTGMFLSCIIHPFIILKKDDIYEFSSQKKTTFFFILQIYNFSVAPLQTSILKGFLYKTHDMTSSVQWNLQKIVCKHDACAIPVSAESAAL